MKKILILGPLAIVGCSQTNQDISQTPTGTETTTKTTNTSQVQEAAAPSPQVPTQAVAAVPTQQVASVPTKQPASLIEQLRKQRDTTKAVYPTPESSDQKTAAPNVAKQIPSAQKLAANIRSSIGCGLVNEEYRTKVVAMAVAQTNQKATEKLTKPQFYQAVRQSIKENQAQANNLVAEFRAKNCAQAKNQGVLVKAPSQKGTVVLEQTGNCKDLSARGISDIDVKANPWASRLDRDKDGIACETN